MAFKNIHVLLTADSTSLRSQLVASARQVDAFSKKVKTSNAEMGTSAAVLSKVAVAGPIAVAVGLAYSARQAAVFETQMRNVNSISHLSEKQFHALGRSVVSMSRELPQSASNLASGLYDIASSGFQGAKGLTVLRASAEAATAGLSDTATAAKGITAVLNAYGMEASAAQQVSDVLFQTVNLGVVTFEELASNVGDVVGSAAAAKISIGEVGAAIAAMTLSGISGAESTTSLNRVIQSLIDPSDALKRTLHGLGYETGAQAIEAIGLHGVMEELRKVTGGNITAMLALFPEIRAARGAFALAANEGKNYNRTSKEIANANNVQGSTHRALREQMKATSAQIRLMVNAVNAQAITLGSHLLPVVNDTLRLFRQLAGVAGEQLGKAITALNPTWRALRDIGIDVVSMAQSLLSVLGPVAGAFAQLGLGTLIVSLNALMTSLAAITGFLEDNKAAVTAVGVAIGTLLLPMLLSAAWAAFGVALDTIAVGLYGVAGAADTAAAGITGLGLVGGAALLGLTIGVYGIVKSFQNSSKHAKEFIKNLDKGADTRTLAGLDKLANKYYDQADAIEKAGKAAGGWKNAFKGAFERVDFFSKHGQVSDARAEAEALDKALQKNSKMYKQLADHETQIMDRLGVKQKDRWTKIGPMIEKVAKNMGVNLTQGGVKGEEAVDKVTKKIQTFESISGLSFTQFQKSTGLGVDSMEALGEAIDEAQKATSKALASAQDLFKAFDPDKDVKSQEVVADAREGLAEATEDLRKAEEERAKVRKRSELEPAEEKLATAREKVAEATDKVREAEKGVTSDAGQITQFYKDRIKDTQQFADDVQTAISRGLDPQFIARALEAGPESAGPVLRTIVSDHTGRLIGMVNDSEQKLQEINVRVVEFARLTTLAVSSKTDDMVKDLGIAMKIASAEIASGGKDTAEAVARAIGIPTEKVRQVAKDYGISLAKEVKSGFTTEMTGEISVGWGINLKAPAWAVPGQKATGGRLTGFDIVGERGPELIVNGLVHSATSNATRAVTQSTPPPQVTIVKVPQQITREYVFTGDINAVADVDDITSDADRKARSRNMTRTGQGGWGG